MFTLCLFGASVGQQEKSTHPGGLLFLPSAPHLGEPFRRSVLANRRPGPRPAVLRPNDFAASAQSCFCQLVFSARRAPLDIRTSERQKSRPAACTAGQQNPNNPSPGMAPFPLFHRLTQQNLCHFVAFIGFQKNHWLCSANERIQSLTAPTKQWFCFVWLCAPPFCASCRT